jgi:hypothetical protein
MPQPLLIPAMKFRTLFPHALEQFALLRAVTFLVGFLSSAQMSLAASEGKVRFNRDIRPIMSDTCFHCHGFDAKTREAGLRLDIREEALKKTESDVFPIVPGKPEESDIIARIFSDDKDDIMPPPNAHKELTPAQKELVRRWVAEGAEYESHWAYAPLVKPAAPGAESANPIDGFIREKLAEKKIAPSPEAPKAKLLRRLSLDLTGLPPTPEETSAFLADPAPDAYEKQVARLLASPRYGERMAVWWLDIARFADTVGFHGDQNQRIFPYRDYVIGAFNGNKPFDQFTVEQLAGDLLPNPTTEQLVATGYNRLNMMTREGGAQPKEYLAKYGAERVRSVAAAWFGSTFGCAECHDHKFDPIKMTDFYGLQAFFADVKQWGVYADYGYTRNPELAGFNNDYPFPPEIEVESPYLRAQKERRESELRALLAAAAERVAADAKQSAAHAAWVKETRAFLAANPRGWKTFPAEIEPVQEDSPAPAEGADMKPQPKEKPQKSGDFRTVLHPGAGTVAAVRIALSEMPKGAKNSSVRPEFAVLDADGRERKIGVHFADADAKKPQFASGHERIGVTSGWVLPKEKNEKTAASVWLLDPPVRLSDAQSLVVKIAGRTSTPPVVSISPLADADPLRIGAPAVLEALRSEAPSPEQRRLAAETWLVSAAPDRAVFDQFKTMSAAIRECRDGKAWTLVTRAAEQPLTVRVLPRGNWQDESGPVVLPLTPSFLPGQLTSTEEKRLTRLDLARWIVSKENPITARTVMNRMWQMFFGTGLSAVIDDLGSQGELPSHPELLDWLASEFRDSGWNVKHMARLIVTSATYRQSSSLRPELRDIDPANRLLTSQNPRRLEAEFIRDNALFVAGALNLRDIGGPSAKPYQPAGYYEALQFPDRDYVPSRDDEQWRRGVYTHWQRTFLHPMLANFDAPARDECAAQRVVSNTPQQALTLLNDPSFVEAARLFASRLAQGEASDDARIDRAFLLAVARPAREKERAALKTFLATQREHFKANADDAEKLLKIGNAPPPQSADKSELAAWTSLCRVVLNAQEAITRY